MNLDRFSVATFNLYNLQLPGEKLNPRQKVWTQAEFDRKVAWIGGQLAALDADIVGLQELWHADAMAQVLSASGLDTTYELLAQPATGARIVCGALVRKGLRQGDARWLDKFPELLRLEEGNPQDPQVPAISVIIPGFSRPVLRFQVALRDGTAPTQVFVAHFKSKLPTEIDEEPWFSPDFKPHAKAIGAALATIRRTAEAAALRVLLTGVMKDSTTPVIVLGDLNDGQHSNTVNILTEQPRYLVGDARGGADNGLYAAQTLQELRDTRDVYYTHVHADLRESLDHVLVSEQFYDHSRNRLWLFDGLAINNDHLHDDDRRRTGTGDHGVVKVSFRWRPVKKES